MSVTTQSFLIPVISVCLFSGVLFGSIYGVKCLAGLRSVGHTKVLAAQAVTGFAPPLVMLFAWERIFSKAISFNVISMIWLLLIALSIVLLSAKPLQFAKVKSYAAGLLLGCCAFFLCAIYLAMLD